MKKFVILTSVLALAACGGGSGGPDDRFVVNSSGLYLKTTKDAADSNKKVTNMRSEIAVCNGICQKNDGRVYGTNHPSNYNLYRKSNYTLSNGDKYDIYDLSDTKFDVSDGKTFTFIIDNADGSETYGQIKGIKVDDTEYKRDNESSKTFSTTDESLSYKSFVKSVQDDDSFVLVYSDFGTLGGDKLFSGGYKDLRFSAPESTMNFSGYANGIVKNTTTSKQIDGTATLKFESGDIPTETLTMTFNDWYKVDIVNKNSINFTKLNDNTDITVNGGGTLDADIWYYGVKNEKDSIQEATGSVNYIENDIQMDVVFGTKKIND